MSMIVETILLSIGACTLIWVAVACIDYLLKNWDKNKKKC